MNKRTVVLLSVCFLLAVTTLTLRYIEQEKENIKSRFIGQEPVEEKQAPQGSYARGIHPTSPPAGDMPGSVNHEGNLQPPAAVTMPLSAGAAPTVAQPSPPNAAPPAVRQAPAAPGGEKSGGRGTIPLPEAPVSAALDDVTTPLGSEEPAAGPEAHGGGGADSLEAQAVFDERSAPEGAGEGAADAGKTVAVEEQADQVAVDGKLGEKIEEEENDAPADEGGGEEEDTVGEGEFSEDEVAPEEEQAPAEGEVPQEEGATGRKEELPYEE